MHSWMEKIYKHPLVILITLVISIIGLVLMIVIFFASQTSRELVYAVNPIRTEVVNRTKVSGIQIVHDGVDLGDVDITAAQIAIWNSGKESIRKENILKDIMIKTSPPVKILEVSVVKYYRDSDVTGFSVSESKELIGMGKVPVEWNILEKNDGACIQLIYLGSKDVIISVEGLIEGNGEVGSVGSNVKIKSPDEQVKSDRRSKWATIGIVFLWGILSYIGVYIFLIDANNWKERIFPIMLAMYGTGNIGAGVWFVITKMPSVPPFGF